MVMLSVEPLVARPVRPGAEGGKQEHRCTLPILNPTSFSAAPSATFRCASSEPGARQRDAAESFDAALYRKVGDLGLTGLGIAPERDGGGGGLLQTAIATEELARFDPSMSLTLLASLSLATIGIERFGTDAQKEQYVPPLARGESVGAFCLTEPNAGSDAASGSTHAAPKDGGYLLNGAKTYITNGDVADTLLVFATAEPGSRAKGIVSLIVEAGAPGLEARKQHGKLGMRASTTSDIYFDDVFVPDENLVAPAGEGFKVAMQILDASRPIIGAQAVGIAQGAFDLAMKHVNQRKQFGQTIAGFQGVQWMLADMATQLEAARLLTYQAASLHDDGLPFAKQASMAKLFASETATRVADMALQLHGGIGYFKESPVERYYRDAKVTEIYEGTSQIQRLVISRHVLAEAAR